MPEISLRAYLEEIDRLIEREQLDESIAHCRHILQTYPKHLATYRLLGKAYLEAKRYGDAADIFQRVLSAIPDDFVAHIGMAIVREDEGNLDAAIWHMERSFETNPANPAIQQEMIRLIGRRDGLEPHKVRLTRGALARMYAHGELFPQAIAELRSALQEDPERPDLQVLLSQMYWKTDQRAEATAVCNRILLKLPYAYEANRIIATALRASNKPEEATIHHRRLAGLDPYFSFLESADADPKSVEASTVNLNRLEWQPGQPIPAGEPSQPGQPGWAESLGVDLREEEIVDRPTGPLPSWLDPDQSPPTPSPTIDVTNEPTMNDQSDGTPEESQVPSWMKDAGWTDSSGDVEETPVSFSDEELSSLDAGDLPPEPQEPSELTPAEIPDWLLEIAPEEGAEAEADESAPQVVEAEEPAPQVVETDEPAPQEAEPVGGVPGWLEGVAAVAEDVSPEPTEPPPAEDEPIVEPPAEVEPTAEPQPVAETEDDAAQQVPTWLDREPPGASETIVTWLEDREEPEAEADQPEPTPVEDLGDDLSSEETPDWLATTPEMEAEEPSEEEEIPGWLSGVAEAAAQDEEAPAEDLDWIREQLEDAPDEEEEEILPQPERTAEAPDWLQTIAAPEDEVVEPDEAPEVEELEAVPTEKEDTWLREFAAPEPQAEPIEGPAEDELSWMEGIGDTEEEPVDEAPALDRQPPDWLQGIAEGEPSAEPAVSGDAPDWLAGLGESLDTEEAAEEAAEEAEVQEEEGELEWLTSMEEEVVESIEEPEPAEAPDWLSRLQEEDVAEVEPAPVDSVEEPDWLTETDDEPTPEGISEPSEEAPDWLQGIAVDDQEPEAAPTVIHERPPVIPLEDEPSPVQDEPSPEPGVSLDEPEPAEQPVPTPSLEGTGEIDDEQVSDWLESLAAGTMDEIEPVPTVQEFLSQQPTIETEPPEAITEERELPEKPEESLQWLEDLAEKRGIDVAVEEEAQTQPPIAEPPYPGTTEWDETPEWLRKVTPREDKPAMEHPPDEVEAPVESAELVEDLQPEDEPSEPQVETVLPTEETIEIHEEEAPPVDEPALPPEVEVSKEITTEEEPVWIEPEELDSAQEAEADTDVPEWLRAPVDAQPVTQEVDEAVPSQVEPVQPEPVQAEPEVLTEAPVEEPAPPPPTVKQPATQEILENARKALAAGDHDKAVEHYGVLIKQKVDMEKVIEDLRLALDRTPKAAKLWQALGDAFMREDKTAEAIEAYQKGMEAS